MHGALLVGEPEKATCDLVFVQNIFCKYSRKFMTSSYRVQEDAQRDPKLIFALGTEVSQNGPACNQYSVITVGESLPTWFQICVQNYIPVGSGKKVNSPHTMS